MKSIAFEPSEYKILIVDDIATNIMLLKALLGRVKYNLVTASGGYEALEKVASESPDLILLDIMMPDIDGYEVIQRLKADPLHKDIPVIFLTAMHNPEYIIKGFKLGASDYVSKPFNHEELLTRVGHHIFVSTAQNTIIEQRDQLKATMEARDQMYSVIAHDMRSPIGTLKMIFNMLIESISPETIGAENFDMLSMGNNITESTFLLLDNLLKWTKSQTGKMNAVFQSVNIAEVLIITSQSYELMAKLKNINIRYEINDSIDITCDIDMVKTIIRNLLSNAIKYSHDGGEIVISLEDSPTHVIVHIQDFGMGVSKEDIPKLLDASIHHSTYGTRNEEGSGLGLQLCRSLTHRNGGDLTIESEESKGSIFSFSLAKQHPEATIQ